MTAYETEALDRLSHHLPKHALVEALLGVAYEIRTANLLTLDRTLAAEADAGKLSEDVLNFHGEISLAVLERLGFEGNPVPATTREAIRE